jgi:hypothetical protein
MDLKKLPLRVRKIARQLTRERWDREAAKRNGKKAAPPENAAKHDLTGRWYVRTAEVGRLVAQVRLIDGTPLRLNVPNPQYVGSSLWKLLGGPAENDDQFLT